MRKVIAGYYNASLSSPSLRLTPAAGEGSKPTSFWNLWSKLCQHFLHTPPLSEEVLVSNERKADYDSLALTDSPL